MNLNEYHSLSLSSLYRFDLYNGDSFSGFMVDTKLNEFFIIEINKRALYNKNPNQVKEIGISVALDAILVWKEIDPNIVYEGPQHYDFSERGVATKLIILGAGASYDFDCRSKNESERPPLCDKLFSERFEEILKDYEGAKALCSGIIRYLRNGRFLEDFFQDQWKIISRQYNKELLAQIINTQFYIQHLFYDISSKYSGSIENNYIELVKKAHEYTIHTKEKVIFVSFNYDTLFEEALTRALRLEFFNINDYVNFESRQLLLFKPHGSWNWVKQFGLGGGIDRAQFIANNWKHQFDLLKINKSLNKNKIEIISSLDQTYPYYPHLLLPYKSKDAMIMPDYHNQLFDHYLSDIKEVLIIGWKGNEEKFNEKIKRSLGHKKVNVFFVNGNETTIDSDYQAVLQNVLWKQFQFNNKPVKTFSEFGDYCSLINDFFK